MNITLLVNALIGVDIIQIYWQNIKNTNPEFSHFIIN